MKACLPKSAVESLVNDYFASLRRDGAMHPPAIRAAFQLIARSSIVAHVQHRNACATARIDHRTHRNEERILLRRMTVDKSLLHVDDNKGVKEAFAHVSGPRLFSWRSRASAL